MANLETLELTINANAESASQGLQGLKTSLSSLSRAVTSTYKKMLQLNSELLKLKTLSETKLPSVGQSVTSNTSQRLAGYGNAAQRMQEQTQATTKSMESVNEATSRATSSMRDYSNAASSTGNKSKGFVQGMKDLGKSVKEMLPKFNLLNRVLRVASTMLIRMGVKALFKGAKEGFDNFYQYANATGNAFASQMDKVYSAWGQIKNQLGASLASVFSAALPVINSLASAALTAFNYVSQLIALLTGKNSWSKATEQALSYADAIDKANKGKSGGGGGMKELLADFDELNVIASESGGGGGGAAATAQAYEDMFEEITEFDEKIRAIADFVKETIDWIKENIDIVLIAVGAIGLAILGWKISEAFDGALATIGKILAGAALVTLGVVLEFDFGTKLGAQLAGGASVNWGDIVEGIAGIIAAGMGGYLIGGGVGAGIGIAFAITATIAGIIVGWKNERDKQRWGQRSLTPEDINRYVISQFNFKVNVEVELVNAAIKNARAAKSHLNGAISEFSRELDKIKFGVDTSSEAIEKAKGSMDTVIAALRDYTKESENLLTTYLQVMPYDETQEGAIQTDIFSANQQLNEYFENQGKKAAELYDKGMRTGWSEGEQEQILALMEHVNNIFAGADMNRVTNDAIVQSRINLADLTRDSAQGVLAEQKKILEEHKSAMKEAVSELAEELLYYADVSDAAGLVDKTTGKALGDIYRARAAELVDGFEETYEQKLSYTKQTMKKEWISALKEIYGEDAFAVVTNWAGDQYSRFEKELKKSYKRGEVEARKTIKEYLGYMEDEFLRTNPIMKEASEMFGITGWELFSNDAKTVFVHSIYESIGVQGVSMLKDELNLSASEIMQITNWDVFSADQKVQFLNALVSAYGASEALRVAKEAGINVKDSINSGLSSKNEETRKAAKEIVNAIDSELANVKGVKIDAEADLQVKIDAIVNITPNVANGVVKGVEAVTNFVKTSMDTFGWSNFSGAKATGAYGVPAGDVFIANEQGAELVGSINGKTSVANQEQIIEGIQRGVSEANSEQNVLLRQQNELLRGILAKEYAVKFGASASFGRTAKQSIDMYNGMIGG